MGVQDFESMYDTIDLSQTGTVSCEQLHKFCEALYLSPVCIQHVEGAMKVICQTPTSVTRREFLDVLTDIERRRTTDEQAYWDFQALDYTGRSRISLHDALMLFKEIHGDSFSMSTWNRFLSSREVPDGDVCYDEIRFWLCSPPIGSASSDKDVKEVENKLLATQGDHYLDEYNSLGEALDDDASKKREHDEHTDQQTAHARRKLNKWNKQGIEAMLFDDGLDIDDTEVKVKSRGHVTINDLNELLEMKYDALKEKMMIEMARQASAVEDEIPEIYEQVRRHLKKMIKNGSSVADDVPGGDAQMLASLTGLMGELRLHDREHRRQMEELKISLKEKGKPLREIAMAVQEKYEQIIAGETTCAGIMQQIHRRHRQEREALIATLKIDTGHSMTQTMVVEYARLMRQMAIMEEEAAFVSVATAVGLAERAMEPRLDRSDWDRSRSERLAQLRIEERIGKKPVQTSNDQPDIEALEKHELVDLQVAVAKEMTKKHFFEREALIHMLLSKGSRDGIEKVKKVKSDDRKNQLKSLQSQHKNWKSSPRADKSILQGILHEALCLKFEERRQELQDGGLGGLTFEEMREVLLADLQQRQGSDFEGVLQDMQKLGQQQVIVVLGRQCGSRIGQHYDNIAFVLLGTMDISEEDEDYIKALDHKYEILRKRMFLMALRDKMDWKNMPKQEKQAALREIGKQEKLFRSEGKFQQMEDLLGPKAKAKILPALRSLIGEDKAEYHKRKQSQKHDEVPIEQTKVVNALADLIPRYDNEHEFLLSWLHSPEGKSFSLRMKRMRIVEIKVETVRVEMEEDFEIATLSAGLMERVKDTLTRRHEGDMNRQSELSRRRVQQRRLRLQQHEEYRQEPEVQKDKVPSSGDITGLQVVYLREMLKRHMDEREVLLTHLQDESLDDLVEAAATMSDDERQRRLIELQGKRQNLNLTLQDDKDEHVSILEESAALRAVSVREQLAAAGNSNNMEMVAMALLAELQEEQDREVALTLDHIENMNEEDIRTSLSREINNRRLGNAWNVIVVFTRYQGEATDDLLLKALENKYVMLRQKLLVDVLRIRMGTDQWQDLSQNEKQQKLMMIDSQAVEQLKIGKIMPSLLGESFKLQETITQMMGVCQHVFRNKVKGQQVTGNQMNLSMEEDTGAVSKKDKPENPLKILYQRLEEERLALVRQLKGQAEDHFSESERLVQLARYNREILLSNQQESFVTVATMVGLFERQQETIAFRLEKDVARYEKIVKKLLQDIDKGRQLTVDVEKPQTRSVIDLVDYIMGLLENKHVKERELFCRLLENTGKSSTQHEQAVMASPQERKAKMTELREVRNKSVQERRMENMEALTEGTVYKMVDRRELLSVDNETVIDETLTWSLMASLLEYQNSEAEQLVRSLAGKTDDYLPQEEQKVLQASKSNMADNIALVVLSPDPTDGAADDEVIEALQGKYDALKDKLLAEALMKELGESEWNRLSEKERQKRIFELKMKDRQLRKAGRMDEANFLIAELLRDKENLKLLMGESTQDQRRKLEERLRRRKERLAKGMSEEEADELEKQDIAQEEAEEKYKRKSILEDLEHRFEQEKEELLRRLQEAGDDVDRERERQANLARLRRDQRLAQKEGNFDSAALILGLGEQRDKDLRLKKEEERERQEKLARERLEAARERRAHGQGEDVEEPVDVNTDDTLSLQEAIARDMDRRHKHERHVFMKLMDESVNSPCRKAAVKMSQIERDDKLFELNELYKNWDNSDDRDIQEQMQLLVDAISLMLELLKEKALADGEDLSEDEVQVKLLADLQQQQTTEAQRLLNDMELKDLKGLQQLHKALTTMKSDRNYDNIAAVLLGNQSRSQDENEADEDEGITKASVLKALEEKYDAMKDKLLVEALMKEMGEREWDRLTEKQRQKKLIDLKLKERQLRRAGKYDEIADIIGSHLENEKLLDQFLVETEEEQRKRFEDRLARRKQLIAEREAEGLATDEDTINEIIGKEEEEEMRQRRRNILEDLQKNFDDEKDQLLRTLSEQKNKAAQERQRQIEFAKLKRDQRKMKKGEKLNDVAMLIHEAKETDKKREENITAERERQRALAKERLEARRRKKVGKQTGETADEERVNMEDTIREAEGRSVHEALLITMETKQEDEMDVMMALLETAKTDKRAAGIPDEELKHGLTKLEQDQLRWRKRSSQQVDKIDEANMTLEQSQKHMADVARNRSNQLKLLTEAIVNRLEVERRMLTAREPNFGMEKVEEEIEVAMVTDLQEKQTAETRAVQKLMDKQKEDVLREMKRNLHVANREGWYDNLTQTIFHISHTEGSYDEEVKLDQQFDDNLVKLDEEMEQKTQETIQRARASGEPVDEDEIRRQIMEQYEQTKQKLYEEKQAQKEVLKQKLNARKFTKDQKDYEALTARALIQQANDNISKIEQNVAQEKGKQSNALQLRLAERRSARQEAKNIRDSMQREDTLDTHDDKTSRGPGSRGSSGDSPLPPFGGMRREKTVVDVDVSEEQKQALLSQMAQQQRTLQSKISEQQRRQEEMLRRRLNNRMGKQQEEAAEVFSLGQRQKTILEKSQQDEKQRQLEQIRDRVTRQREKREPSPGAPKLKKGKK